MKSPLLLILSLALCLAAMACASDDATATPATTSTSPASSNGSPTEVSVEVRSFSIQPSTTTLQPGQTVRFTATNTSASFHTFTVATSSDKEEILVDLELNGEDSKSQEMTVPTGATTLYYFCRPHELGGMNGSFSIGAATSGADTETKTPTVDQSASDYY